MGQKELVQENGSRPALIRAMGRWDLTAVGVNQVIGSGIFIMPATVALTVGIPSSLLPWVAAGMANALIVLCFAEAGTRFREAGGPYAYARTAFGPFVGFEVAWMMWVTRVVSQAALANAFALYVGRFWPPATEGPGRLVVVTLLLVALAGINLAGVRYGSLAINFFTVSKLAPIALFLGVGIFFIEPGNFEGMFDFGGGTGTFGAAVLMLMFTFGGYELITIPASEARSPRRDAPRALLLTIGIVFAIYFLVQLVVVGTLPGLDTSTTPLADAGEAFAGPRFGTVIAIGGLLSIAGSNAGSMLAGPRVTFALGDKGQLPAFFAHVHGRYRTPDVSILIYSGVAIALAYSGTFAQLATLSAVARIVFYMTTCAAVPVLRRRVEAPADAFELPGGMLVPGLALIVSVVILANASEADLKGGGIALAIGAAFYLLTKLSGKRP
ncbi:MAG: amino acid permease [Acidobacteria bacterium]|nr:amino acid permease [Acidobacteriota bacterium]